MLQATAREEAGERLGQAWDEGEGESEENAFERLCEQLGLPQVLRKFPLVAGKPIPLQDEADRERDLAERQLEARLRRHYARLIDRLYWHARGVAVKEEVVEEEEELWQPVASEVHQQQAETANGTVRAEQQEEGEDRGVVASEQLPSTGCEFIATMDPEARAQSPPAEEHWLRAALSVPDQDSDDGLSQGDGARAERGGVDDDVMVNREEEPIDNEMRSEAMEITQASEQEEFDVYVPLTCPDDHIDDDEELSFPPSPKSTAYAAADTSSKRKREEERKHQTHTGRKDQQDDDAAVPVKKSRGAGREPKKSPAGPKTSQEDAARMTAINAATILIFYRRRPYYCAARDTEGFVWTGRSLLDEWDSTDDFPGSGFTHLWSLTRPKRLDLHKFTQACERVRQRSASAARAVGRDKQGARFLGRNVRLVRESAATARLPTFSSEGNVFAAGDGGQVDDMKSVKEEEEDAVVEAEEEAEEEEEEFRPKYAAPPSPPKVRKRRSSKPKRSSTKTVATSTSAPSASLKLGSKQLASTSARQYRRRDKSSSSPPPTFSAWSSTSVEEDLVRQTAPAIPPSTARSSSSTSSESVVRRITPTTVASLPMAQSRSRPQAAATPTARRPTHGGGGARGERMVEISFPLARRTPTLRAGQNDVGGGRARLRVMPRHNDDEAEESLSDADDPFGFP